MSRRLAAILLAALALRVAFVLHIGGGIVQSDEGVYVTLGRNLASRGVLGSGDVPESSRPPALPVMLAAVFSLTGGSVLVARLFSALLGTLVVWLIHRYALEVMGEDTADLAAGFAAAYPFFLYWSGVLMTEMVSAASVLAAVVATRAVPRAGERRGLAAAGAGLAWGLAVMARSQNLAFVGPAAAWLVWRRRAGEGRLMGAAAVLLAAAAVLPLSWMLRNRAQVGSFSLDNHSGYTLLVRAAYFDEDNIDTGVAQAALEKTELYARAMALPVAERDRLFARAAFEFIRAHPALYARHCVLNALQFWRFAPRTDKTVGVVESSFLGQPRRRFVAVALLTEPWLILLAAYGAWLAFREGRAEPLGALFVAGTTLIHALVIPQMRYRIPVMPWVIVWAAYAAVRLRARWRARG